MAIGGGRKSGGGGSGGGKGRWITLGKLWEPKEKARHAASGRIDSMPVDNSWDGRVFLYPYSGGKNEKNPADYKLVALVGGGEQQSSSSGSSGKDEEEEGDDFDTEPGEENLDEEDLGLQKASDIKSPPEKQRPADEGPTTCGFCGETVTSETIYCPVGKDLRDAKENEGCRLGLPRDPEDVPDGQIPF